MIPADPLSQLREKDPELHSRYINLMTDIDPLVDSDIPFCQLAIMQACLQDAIRARGWFYQIVSKGEWFLGTRISDLGVEAYVGPDPGQDLDTGYGDTEAEALCAAYLAALEATE